MDVVDDPERRLAARRRAAHPVQHDGAAAARPADRGHLRRARGWSSSTRVGGVADFFCSSLAGYIMPPLPIIGGGALTLGASAPIFGLVGALVYYGRRGGSSLDASRPS